MFLKHVSSTASFVRRLLLSSRPLSSSASASLAADKLFTPLTNPSDAQTCYGLPYLRIPATFFPPAPTSVFVSSSSPESFLASPSSKVSSFLVAEVFDTPSAFHRKFEEEGYNVVGGLCKRLVEEDVDITKEDALELDVPNPGARKGRKWTKVSRKAARLEAVKAATPIKVEILEVGNEGMLTKELAYNLAISKVEILEYLYSKGIKPVAVHILDKDMV